MKTRKLFMLDYTPQSSYRHEYLPTAREIVEELGRKSGMFETLATDDCSIVNSKDLGKFSALLFATSGDLPVGEDQKKALLKFVRDGAGLIGVHNAASTFRSFPEFGAMLGGYFSSHPWSQEVTVKVEDQTHPATRHLPKTFRVKEEVYEHEDWIGRGKTHVLISLDNSSK